MKSKLLLLSILMLLMVTTNYAQSSANVSGVAVQGIARDDNNTALINAQVRFAFTIYDKSSSDVVHAEDLTITTDEFGVFSHTIAIPTEKYANFGGKVLWLKIEDDNDVISDEIFKHVPYAINASNGVPTGSIMPYVGSTAPPGWVLCNGQALGPIPGSENLSLLIGASAPDLRGMFLRGTGTSPENGEDGPALMATQGDAIKTHAHDIEVTISSAGSHNHDIIKGPIDNVTGVVTSFQTLDDTSGENEAWRPINGGEDATSTEGAHTHPNSSATIPLPAVLPVKETRPVNYGVNYIIKL